MPAITHSDLNKRLTWWAITTLFILAALVWLTQTLAVFSPEQGITSLHVVLLLFATAIICEYIDSSLGMGYGTLLSPLLLLCGYEPLQVVPAILFSELITGLAAAIMHHKDGNVDLISNQQVRKTVVILGALSIIGAILAASIAHLLPVYHLKLLIGGIIATAGIITLVTLYKPLKYRLKFIITLGTIAAFNKGMSGGGYGPLVTSGQIVSGMPAKQAIAITSLAEAITCLVGLLSYTLIFNNSIDWTLALPLLLGAVSSVPLATITVKKLPEQTIRSTIGFITLLLGLLAIGKVLSS